MISKKSIRLDLSSEISSISDVFDYLPCQHIQQLRLRENNLSSLKVFKSGFYSMVPYLEELSLQNNCFSVFPREILILKNLTALSLSKNSLQTIPKGTLGELTNLLWLNFSQNKLSELPVDLIHCTKLKGLDLSSNQFVVHSAYKDLINVEFPSVLCHLTGLEILSIQNNHIHDIPNTFGNLQQLTTLDIGCNALTDIPPVLLHSPPFNLAHLYISANPICNIHPSFLSVGYQHLVSLDMHTCQLEHLNASFFENLSKSEAFVRLNLGNNKLNRLPLEIGYLTHLQWLNLKGNQLVDIPYTIGHLINLERLGLGKNRLQTLPHNLFLHMTKLKKLDLQQNHLKYLPFSLLSIAPSNERRSDDSHRSTEDGTQKSGSLEILILQENLEMEDVDGIFYTLNDDTTTQVNIFSTSKIQDPNCSAINLMRSFMSTNPKNLIVERTQLLPSYSGTNTDKHRNTTSAFCFSKSNSLKETCICNMLNDLNKKDPIFNFGHQEKFLQQAVSSVYLPQLIQSEITRDAKQCDRCCSWYTGSRFQVGYTSRFLFHVPVVVRMNVCSLLCAFSALVVIRPLSRQEEESRPAASGMFDDYTLFWAGREGFRQQPPPPPPPAKLSLALKEKVDDKGPPAIHADVYRFVNGWLEVAPSTRSHYNMGDPTPNLTGFRFLPSKLIQLSKF